jgi:hypothetical protein
MKDGIYEKCLQHLRPPFEGRDELRQFLFENFLKTITMVPANKEGRQAGRQAGRLASNQKSKKARQKGKEKVDYPQTHTHTGTQDIEPYPISIWL